MIKFRRTEEEHDRNLTNFLNRAREHGLKTRAEKIQYKCDTYEHSGFPGEFGRCGVL